ncbi:MAG: hypothetical protein J5I90_06665 [Caldilineales bacterium]|nr:hypothetical protein [Caldilineales bacterium]
MLVLQVVAFVAGFALVVFTLISAIRTFVLARAAPDWITSVVFRNVRRILSLGMRHNPGYAQRDRIMAFYAPVGLLVLLPVWLFLVALGFSAMYWATGITPWTEAFTVSGSSLLTLGFARGDFFLHTIFAFIEATIGLILVALLIAYLPTMYSAFSRRELAVTLLEVRAGSPPSAVEMLIRHQRIGGIKRLGESWRMWESWFAEVQESHTSLASLVFFRSPDAKHSWVTASGAVLDAASITLAAVDIPFDPDAALCIRSGFLALRRITAFFGIPFNREPSYPDEPISVSRTEFDAACETLREADVPIKADLDAAWRDFAGWRVNYDRVLLALCSLTVAPPAPWSSDRVQYWSIGQLREGALDEVCRVRE